MQWPFSFKRRRLWKLTPYGKLLRTFPQGLENGAPTPFPTATHSLDDDEMCYLCP